jgi:hypothetical protein
VVVLTPRSAISSSRVVDALMGLVSQRPDPNLQRIAVLQVDRGGWVQVKNLDGEFLWLNTGAIKVIQEISK